MQTDQTPTLDTLDTLDTLNIRAGFKPRFFGEGFITVTRPLYTASESEMSNAMQLGSFEENNF